MAIDWEAIEKEYRLGQKSIRNIASAFKISHPAILKRAKKEGWVRDKSDEVRQLTNAKLIGNQNKVTKEVTNLTRDDVDIAVETNLQVVYNHRKSIKDGQELVATLFDQLKDAANNRERIEELIIEDTNGSDGRGPNLKQRNAMMKAVSLPAHAGILRDLSMALKNLVPLERQAFNIDDRTLIIQNNQQININSVDWDGFDRLIEYKPENVADR